MKKTIVVPLLILLFSYGANAQIDQLEQQLSRLPHTTFEKVETNPGFQSTYELNVRQPLDHRDSTKGFFLQRVYLSHRGFESPSIITTEGYRAFSKRIYEPTKLLNANQLAIEHRFFGSSVPDSLDYRHLNLEQATADLHRIKLLFENIYKEKWISTGVSKGGVTTIFYRYFHPEDVAVSIPYLAPIKESYEEERIYHFLDTVGTKSCRQSIETFQRRLLENRSQILPILADKASESSDTFSFLTLNEAFEYAVMEYSFAFWQWGESCENIPTATASMEQTVDYFLSVSSPFWFSDQSIKKGASHNYQIATELGYYGYQTNKFKDLLIDLPSNKNPMCIFLSDSITAEFNGTLLNELGGWLQEKGDRFIYIYGAKDPWSAAAVQENDQVDSEWFMLKDKHHGSARIANMTTSERERLISALERWLSIEIKDPSASN